MGTLIETVGPWWPVWALAVAVLGVGRLTRLITFDKFPPVVWIRKGWSTWTARHNHDAWDMLFYCPWCMSTWVALVCLGWFLLTFLAVWVAWTWWLFWGWLALMYLAAMVIVRDEPAGGED